MLEGAWLRISTFPSSVHQPERARLLCSLTWTVRVVTRDTAPGQRPWPGSPSFLLSNRTITLSLFSLPQEHVPTQPGRSLLQTGTKPLLALHCPLCPRPRCSEGRNSNCFVVPSRCPSLAAPGGNAARPGSEHPLHKSVDGGFNLRPMLRVRKGLCDPGSDRQ